MDAASASRDAEHSPFRVRHEEAYGFFCPGERALVFASEAHQLAGEARGEVRAAGVAVAADGHAEGRRVGGVVVTDEFERHRVRSQEPSPLVGGIAGNLTAGIELQRRVYG